MTREINWNVTDVNGKSFSFNDVDALKDFALCEAEFWQKQWEAIQSFGVASQPVAFSGHGVWRQIFDLLVSWEENFNQWDQTTTATQMAGHYRTWAKQLNGRWVWSKHGFVDDWVKSYRFGQETGDAFLQAMQDSSPNANAYKSLRGQILAYEYQLQGASDIVGRRDSEASAFERTRDEMVNTKDALVTEVHGFKTGMEAWSNSIQGNYAEWFNSKQLQTEELRTQQVAAFDERLTEKKTAFDSQMTQWLQRITDLEHTYQDKLRLEKPATYWADRAKKLRRQGLTWSAILAVVVIIGVLGFGYLFTQWLTGVEIALSLHSFQGAVLLTAIISSFVFAVRVTSRLAFSAFHLQRDCEEREQLTHVYLALANDAQTDAESRKIILQSLFSRAETGLLANEAGPTMPIGDFVKAAKPGQTG